MGAGRGDTVKTITFTDDEAEAVRRAVAGLAKSNPHLTTALAKLDRGSDNRKLEIVLDDPKRGSFPAFSGIESRWRARYVMLVQAAVRRGARVTVYVDGAPVDLATLVENEVFP